MPKACCGVATITGPIGARNFTSALMTTRRFDPDQESGGAPRLPA